MSAVPKRRPATPDGAPLSRSRRRKSNVSDVQDPLIAGDSGKDANLVVDEAGQVRRKDNNEVDLLH